MSTGIGPRSMLSIATLQLIIAIYGGYFGSAAFARRLDPRVVHAFVIGSGLVLTVYFFLD